MPSFLEGALAKQVARAFKGKLLNGTLRRTIPGSLNDLGNVATSTTQDYPFEGIREDFSAFYKMQALIPDTDVKVLIIAGSISTTPKQDDDVLISGKWHKVRRILAIDPATATYSLQCTELV